MKSRLVSDGKITASSSYRTWGIDTFTWHPQFARLDKQGKTNAWSPARSSRSEWIQVGDCDGQAAQISALDWKSLGFLKVFVFFFFEQVDLEKTKRLTGIITQGAKDFGVVQFVSVFKMAYSNDGESWSTVKEEDTGNDKVRQKKTHLWNDLIMFASFVKRCVFSPSLSLGNDPFLQLKAANKSARLALMFCFTGLKVFLGLLSGCLNEWAGLPGPRL